MLSAVLVASLGLRVGFKAPATQHPRTAAPLAKIGSVDQVSRANAHQLPPCEAASECMLTARLRLSSRKSIA